MPYTDSQNAKRLVNTYVDTILRISYIDIISKIICVQYNQPWFLLTKNRTSNAEGQ